MKTIPEWELDNHAGRILDRVKAGEEFIVTRRGEPIARLVPVTLTAEERLSQMERTGELTSPTRHPRDLDIKRIEVTTPFDELVGWMKGDR